MSVKRTLAAATGLSVAASLVFVGPVSAKEKDKKDKKSKKSKAPKCTILGSEGSDFISVYSFDKPVSLYTSVFAGTEEDETICAFGGDDEVLISSDYDHPGLTKVFLGDGNDCANVDDNVDAESVDGGAGFDDVAFDLATGDSVVNTEAVDGTLCP